MATKKAVAVAAPKGPLATLQNRGRGFEEETQREDLIIPRAKLLQALSPEVVDGSGKPGQIINSLTKEILPSVFIPVFKFTQWLRFNSRDQKATGYNPDFGPGDLIWRSADPHDPRVQAEGKFGEDGSKPLATKFLNFFSYFPGVTMPVIVSFSASSFKTGKQLLSLAQFTGGDMFSKGYALSAAKEQNDMGTFYVLKVDAKGPASPEDFKFAERLWQDFHAKEIKVDESGAEQESRPY